MQSPLHVIILVVISSMIIAENRVQKTVENLKLLNMEIVTIILTGFVLTFLLWYNTRRPKNFPPGKARIPIIGHFPTGSKPDMELWKIHNIMGFYFGNHPSVLLQNFQLAKELLNKEEWCGRGKNIITQYLRSDNGINKVALNP